MSKHSDHLPISPSLEPQIEAANGKPETAMTLDRRSVLISAIAIGIGLVAGFVADGLVHLIGLITQLAFYHRWSLEFAGPAEAPNWGPWVIVVPVIGGIIVGFMARYGSKAIRGHGIPEAMEQVLLNESRIPARITFLKPLSAAISIGTGGPFGAEGPIIATGGSLGSLIGQLMRTTAFERKTLLAAGAAAGMSATFGSPVSAVLLAVELLLFEFRARSLVPVALASAAAAAVRLSIVGKAPAFPMPDVLDYPGSAIAAYVLIGAIVGLASVAVTRLVYAIEDGFEELPIHWMWWPALGGVAVGLVGYWFPKTLGVGYDNITGILSGAGGAMTAGAIAALCAAKFVSWSISLGSGTSGGTLAPLFTVGGGLGALLGVATQALLPHQGVDPRVAALVGMAAMFAGASRALLASLVFAFETTRQPMGLLPLLGGCSASFMVSALLMPSTIMTEKIVRRGVRVPADYGPDFLELVSVKEFASRTVRSLRVDERLGSIRARLGRELDHQGFPVLDEKGRVQGVVTRRDLLDAARPDETLVGALVRRKPVVVGEDESLRRAADLMVQHAIGRLPVVSASDRSQLVGFLTRSDVLGAHGRRLRQDSNAERSIQWSGRRASKNGKAGGPAAS